MLQPLFYDCYAKPIYFQEFYYLVDAKDKIFLYVAASSVLEKDDCMCFKNFKDARELTIKLRMERCLNDLKNDLMFNLNFGSLIDSDFDKKTKALKVLYARLGPRIEVINMLIARTITQN